MNELQQQVEDLQKALQSQAAKPDDVSVPTCTGTNRESVSHRVNLKLLDFVIAKYYTRKSRHWVFSECFKVIQRFSTYSVLVCYF